MTRFLLREKIRQLEQDPAGNPNVMLLLKQLNDTLNEGNSGGKEGGDKALYGLFLKVRPTCTSTVDSFV